MFSPKESTYDKYRDTNHISEDKFHRFYENNPNASAVIQGFITMIHRELTGEPAIPYSMMFLVTDSQKLKMFLYAFGMEPAEMPSDVDELWDKAVSLFGESKFVAPKLNNSLGIKNPTGRAE